MTIIAKYFEEKVDYINVMKVSKRYHDLVQKYHFNPIQDYSLFENIETQYIYNLDSIIRNGGEYNNWSDENFDVIKKKGMHQYVYLCSNRGLRERLDEHPESNSSIRLPDGYKYIVNNLSKLEEWSERKYDCVMCNEKANISDTTSFLVS